MNRLWLAAVPALLVGGLAVALRPGVEAQQPPPASSPQPAPAPVSVPEIPFDAATDVLKYSADMNLGEVLGVAVNSKNRLVVLNHPGSPTQGPLYGNASTQLLEFDLGTGRFVREIGRNVYGLGYGHSIRFDKYDNLWVVDKGTNAVVKFNPAGFVTMNLGRRPEGPDDPEESWFRNGRGGGPAPPPAQDGYFRGPTDIAFDSRDNLYVSDGYTNARVAKFDKRGAWVQSFGTRGTGGPRADQNPGQLNTPHNIAVDRSDNVYVADRNNRRIQVFDADGTFRRFIFLNATYDKTHHPVLGNLAANPPDETQPWTLCITGGSTQYLYSSDSEPGRIYKMTLDGRIIGTMGISGRDTKQFNWVHALACPTDDTLYVADMNNWRIQKLTLHERTGRETAR
ncbi:MAG TPA: hypothetical protein VM032_07400 [Vicinamibacterales bacterium]|nr:hypothetical protein [Vicinamibacterales bacterium]